MSEFVDQLNPVAINYPGLAEKIGAPKGILIDGQRAGVTNEVNKLKEELHGKSSKLDIELIEQELTEAEIKAKGYQDIITNSLPEEEKKLVIEERMDEAIRIQHIAVGLLLREQLQNAGTAENVIETQAVQIGVGRYESKQAPGINHNQAKEIEVILSQIAEGKPSPVEERHYKEAALIYTWWIRKLRMDVSDVLGNSKQRERYGPAYQASLEALNDVYHQIAKGLSKGKELTY